MKHQRTFALLFAVASLAGWVAPALAVLPSPALLQLSTDGTSASDVETQSGAGTHSRPLASADGAWVVYVHDAEVDEARELWSVPRAGGTPVRLSAVLQRGVGIYWFDITADSSRVVYAVAQETLNKVELYSVPIAGPAGATVKLSPLAESFSNVFTGTPPVLSPDGQWVAFLMDSWVDGVAEAWTAPTDGSAPAARVSRRLSGGGVSTNLSSYLLVTSDSSRVLFAGNLLSTSRVALWSAPLDGSSLAIEMTFTASNLSADVSAFRLTPDGTQVVFLDDREIAGRVELFRRPVVGGAGAQLSPVSTVSPTAEGDVASFVIAPDSSRAAFAADLQADERRDLWTVPLDGDATDAVIVSPGIVAGREAASPTFSPDSNRVAFTLDDGSNDVRNLWSAGAAGTPAAIRHNPALLATADVSGFSYSDDGGYLVYRVLDSGPNPVVARLWTVPARQGFASALELSTSSTASDSVDLWALAGRRVVMIGSLDGDGERRVYRAPVDRSSTRTVVYDAPSTSTVHASTLLIGGGAIAYFRVHGPTGRRIVELPVDGSSPAAFVDPSPGSSGMGVLLAWPTRVGHGVLLVGDYELLQRLDLWISDRPLLRNGFEGSGNGSFTFYD